MSAVLLLNVNNLPLHTIKFKRAMGLIEKGKVEIVEAIPNKKVRGEKATFPFPSILRLRYYVNQPRRGMTWTRRAVLARDNHVCQYCGASLPRSSIESTVDHIIPKSRGGKSTWSNTCAACKPCQLRKRDKSMHEAGMRFANPKFEPKTPRGDYLMVASDYPQSWKKYLRVG